MESLKVIRVSGDRQYEVAPRGEAWLAKLGVNVAELRLVRRSFARQCLDWTERTPHRAVRVGCCHALAISDAGMGCAPPKDTRVANHAPGRKRVSCSIWHPGLAIIIAATSAATARDANPDNAETKRRNTPLSKSLANASRFSSFIRVVRFGPRRTTEHGQFRKVNLLMAKSRSKLRSANSRKKPASLSRGCSRLSIL